MKLDSKKIVVVIAAIIGISLALRVFMLAIEGEEGRLKRSIYKTKRLIEREDLIGLTGSISADYSDELGNGRRSLLFIAKTFFDNCDKIVILINSMEISIENGAASADMEATVYWQEGESKNIVYDSAKVKVMFRKKENRWKLIELKFYEQEKKRRFNPMIG